MYQSIDDIPVYNWFKINETNDLRWMLIDRDRKWHSGAAKNAWEMVYSEYIEAFGINENYLKLLEKQKELLLMNAEKAVDGDKWDPFNQNRMDMLRIDIKQLSTGKERPRTNEMKVHLEKHLGFKINEKETTVKEYYTYLEVMKKDIQAQAARINER